MRRISIDISGDITGDINVQSGDCMVNIRGGIDQEVEVWDTKQRRVVALFPLEELAEVLVAGKTALNGANAQKEAV